MMRKHTGAGKRAGRVVASVVVAGACVAGGGRAVAWDASAFRMPSEMMLRQSLTPMQYKVTREEGTEPPFRNQYWNHHEAGIYVDVVSGEPLFSSLDKFDSGTGWPSFTRPVEAANIRTRTDRALFAERTEIRSAHADSHLGHVFDDGPPPTGRRYCINSAALRFIPARELRDSGYGEYLPLFAAERAAEPTPGK